MGFFALRFLTLFGFLILLTRQEFKYRRQKNLRPQTLKDLFDLGAKWKPGSDKNISALFFASSCFVGFCIWESLILELLNFFPWWRASWLLGTLLLTLLLRKRERAIVWTQKNFLYLAAGVGMLSGAFFCWVLFPWLYFRSRFLIKS